MSIFWSQVVTFCGLSVLFFLVFLILYHLDTKEGLDKRKEWIPFPGCLSVVWFCVVFFCLLVVIIKAI